jgi:hypothetical protein
MLKHAANGIKKNLGGSAFAEGVERGRAQKGK